MSERDEFEDDLGPADEASPDKKTREWAMAIHLSNLAHYVLWPLSIALPIILWQIKKDELPGIDAHGKAAANWAISYSIYLIVSVLLTLILIGLVLLIPLLIIGIVFPIMAGIKANEGVLWNYPLTITFFK